MSEATVEVFRAGAQSDGRTYTEAHLDSMIGAFEKGHPLAVKGLPGTVRRLTRRGRALLAELDAPSAIAGRLGGARRRIEIAEKPKHLPSGQTFSHAVKRLSFDVGRVYAQDAGCLRTYNMEDTMKDDLRQLDWRDPKKAGDALFRAYAEGKTEEIEEAHRTYAEPEPIDYAEAEECFLSYASKTVSA